MTEAGVRTMGFSKGLSSGRRNVSADADKSLIRDTMLQKKPDSARLDRLVADARRNADQREQGYRERALKIYPWICGRCARGFTRENLSQLTVHHRNHNHDDNPSDGSNWELLCLYCHDNEHSRYLEADQQGGRYQVAACPQRPITLSRPCLH